MVKPKARWKGLDREFCCPVTCAKLYNIVAWLTIRNIMWSLDMSNLSYITFIVSFCNDYSIQYTFLLHSYHK